MLAPPTGICIAINYPCRDGAGWRAGDRSKEFQEPPSIAYAPVASQRFNEALDALINLTAQHWKSQRVQRV